VGAVDLQRGELAVAIARGRAAFPDLAVDDDTFVARL